MPDGGGAVEDSAPEVTARVVEKWSSIAAVAAVVQVAGFAIGYLL